jgi:hypothetical protein
VISIKKPFCNKGKNALMGFFLKTSLRRLSAEVFMEDLLKNPTFPIVMHSPRRPARSFEIFPSPRRIAVNPGYVEYLAPG